MRITRLCPTAAENEYRATIDHDHTIVIRVPLETARAARSNDRSVSRPAVRAIYKKATDRALDVIFVSH